MPLMNVNDKPGFSGRFYFSCRDLHGLHVLTAFRGSTPTSSSTFGGATDFSQFLDVFSNYYISIQ